MSVSFNNRAAHLTSSHAIYVFCVLVPPLKIDSEFRLGAKLTAKCSHMYFRV